MAALSCIDTVQCSRTFNRWWTVVSGTWKYDDPRLNMSHEGTARVWHVQPRVVLFPCPTNDCVSYVLSSEQLNKLFLPLCLQNSIPVGYDLDTQARGLRGLCSFSALTLLVGRQEGHSACKKTEWWGAGVVVCLERGADLYAALLIPLPLTVSCSSKIQIGFTFLVPAHLGSPGKRAVKRVCVCVCVRTVSNFSVETRHSAWDLINTQNVK